MFETFIKISAISLPVFIYLTMFNIGLTQKPKDIIKYLKDKGFALRMLTANFILAPFIMWVMLRIFPLNPYLRLGLTIFSISAGASFLIKLTQQSGHDMALGASTMLKLVLTTVIIVPLLLPLIISQIQIDGGVIARTLFKQMILPIVLGWLTVKLLPNITKNVQPWVAKIGNWALYVLLVATLVGYFPELQKIWGQGAILIGIVFILCASGIGYLLGGNNNKEHLRDIGALATGQRNTAASMIIAAQNFSDHPEVLVIITIVNILGIAMLLIIATFLSKIRSSNCITR